MQSAGLFTRRLASLLAISGVVAMLVASPAAGAPIPGATYDGTVTEATAGSNGTISFTVSADGSEVTSVSLPSELEGFFSGGHCTFFYYGPESLSIPIVSDAFSGSWAPHSHNKATLAGTFTGAQSAQGTIRVYETEVGCDTGALSWAATTTAQPPSPPPTPEEPTGEGEGIGTAVANGVAPVSGGKALLKMRCPSANACRGVAKLWVYGSRRSRSSMGQSSAAQRGRVLIGKSRFATPSRKSRTVRVKLNARGKRLLRHARRHRLRVRLTGQHVKARTVLLKQR